MDNTSLHSHSPVMLMNLPATGKRSVSPMSPTPSPSRELRGVRLFRAISRKLGRRSAEDDLNSYNGEDDSRSSSTDSCSSTTSATSARCSRASKKIQNEGSCSSGGSGFRSASPNHISSSGSESGSEQGTRRSRHHHSTTGASFRKVFQSLTINSRSQSCSTTETATKRKTKKTTPKRILRPPVTYTYVRGLSGLPTQRIARTYTNNGCGSCGQYIPGLNR